jgi:hypothetical protein
MVDGFQSSILATQVYEAKLITITFTSKNSLEHSLSALFYRNQQPTARRINQNRHAARSNRSSILLL